jgi:hypothetical protein
MKRVVKSIVVIMTFFISVSSSVAYDKKSKFGEVKDTSATSKIAVGVRLYDEFPGLKNFPVEKDDLGYELMYEYHEGIGYWQLGAVYMPAPDDDRFDYLVSPQINLILKDRIYRIGTGALKTYVKTDDDEYWTDLHWQMILGLGLPLGDHLSIDVYAHYVFKSWKDFTDTDMAAIDYSALLSVSF